jgi:dethiobiotin synthetase
MNLSQLPNQFFVTGTDTEVGKTYCSSLIIKAIIKSGKSVFPFKPIAAGVDLNQHINSEPVNDDAYQLWLACGQRFSIEQINPILLPQAIAPHIAAEIEGQVLDYNRLDQALSQIPNEQYCLIEGAGGWHLPLNTSQLMSTWCVDKGLPVIVVVGIKLGCLNHALLTCGSIIHSGAHIIGWIANFIEGETEIGRKNVDYLQTKLKQEFQIDKLAEVQRDQVAL